MSRDKLLKQSDPRQQQGEMIAHANETETIELRPGEVIRLTLDKAEKSIIGLRVLSGVGRITADSQFLWPDATLAFCGRDEQEWISTDQVGTLLLEGMTPLKVHLSVTTKLVTVSDLISEWLVILHVVRHHFMAEKRFLALLRVLITHFGVRVPRGYRLPFALGHSRVAELIGVTRSTATRQFTLLRREGLLFTDRDGTLLAMPRLIEDSDFGSLLDV